MKNLAFFASGGLWIRVLFSLRSLRPNGKQKGRSRRRKVSVRAQRITQIAAKDRKYESPDDECRDADRSVGMRRNGY
jgi:hypothetical protein